MACTCNLLSVTADPTCPVHGAGSRGSWQIDPRRTAAAPAVMADHVVIQPSVAAAPAALAVQVGGGHYKGLKIQPIEYIHANNIPFAEGSAIKYLTRWRDKGGIEDLKKARHFIDLLIELETKAGNATPAKV